MLLIRKFMCLMNLRPIWICIPLRRLKSLMGGLKAEGHTIIVAEHRLYYLTDLADRFLYMENGSMKRRMDGGRTALYSRSKKDEP